MTTLKIDEAKARELYKTASAEFKTMLEDTFTKEFFSQKITDLVGSFEDACKVLRLDPSNVLPGFRTLIQSKEQKAIIAYTKLITIIQALNEGWTPNWDDKNEPKYYCWFEKKKPGFVLDSVDCDCAITGVSSRLCFKSRELAEFAAAQFLNEYNDFLTA